CRRAQSAPNSILARTLNALDIPFSEPRPFRDRLLRFVRRTRRPIAAFTLAAAAVGVGWARYIETEPRIAFPASPASRGPNALSEYMNAASLVRDQIEFGAMLAQASPVDKPSLADVDRYIMAMESGTSGSGDSSPSFTLARMEKV